MTIATPRFPSVAALVSALALGAIQSTALGKSGGPMATQEPAAGKDAVPQLAKGQKDDPTSHVTRLADALKRHPPPRSSVEGERMQL
jgi:hypothetical protein